MGRLQKVTDLGASSDIISNATYGAAGQLLSMTGANGAPSETRTYNSIGQMTELQSGGLDIQYAYSATQNNGKITSQYDAISGEQIVYTYDSLNRLASATGSGWGQSYTYDGFGNLTNVATTKGSTPTLVTTYDPATNRQTGECADANGNICGDNLVYDVENRIVRKGVLWAGHPDAAYSYAPGNKRVWRGVWDGSGAQTVDELTFWSVNGQKLVTYQLSTSGSSLVAMATGTNQYFGGKLVKNATGYVTPDRLGSIGKYFPYGQERPSATTDGKEKFATYFRDSETGLDYAENRYHQPGMGRFATVDRGPAHTADPGSWNRYAYGGGDPVNHNDPSGLCYQDAYERFWTDSGTDCWQDSTFLSYLRSNGSAQLDDRTVYPAPETDPCVLPENSDGCGFQGPGGGTGTSPGGGGGGGGAPPKAPPCPEELSPPTGVSADQLQQNIDAAHAFFNDAMSVYRDRPDQAFAALMNFFVARFRPGGAWDYKAKYQPGTAERSAAQAFGNFNFGAVLQSFNFSYTFTQSAAGVAQIGICLGGGSCGSGIPFRTYPFGDQATDAVDVQKGYDFEAAKRAGCQ
jgi:RHS repeat-associated protein